MWIHIPLSAIYFYNMSNKEKKYYKLAIIAIFLGILVFAIGGITMTLSDAQIRANKKWNDKNKDKMNYFRRKSDSKNFILKYANEEDLNKTLEYIKQRRNELKS